LAHKNLSVEDILNELSRREGMSGIEEKQSRAPKVK
jgi:phosphoribosyl-ATP pyrophosphohydrolase